ncbi:unnamed protein product [Orchesella dallaii]|uniref:Uncharacterized protein n=1 Tax=Orchesella dallaii TaxID=48710 RepID=A0ABP1R9S0_9HEXA
MGLFLSTSQCASTNSSYQKNTSRVFGRKRTKNSILCKYHYPQNKITKEYLKCEIEPWKNLKSFDEKICLEPLNSKFLRQNSPPQRRVLRKGSVKCAWVFGYRELCMKREYAEYLRDVKQSNGYLTQPSYLVLPYWKLARGGGPKEKPAAHKKTNKPEPAADSNANSKSGTAKKPVSNKLDTKSSGKDGKAVPGKPGGGANQGPPTKAPPGVLKKRILKRRRKNICPWFDRCRKKRRVRGKEIVKKDPATILREQKAKKWKWPNKRKRYPVPPSPKLIVLLHRLYRLPKEKAERDSEWLYLSDTDPDDTVVETFEKGFHSWMTEGISIESQKLLRHLQLFLTILTLTGRSFLHHRPNFAHGHIEFSARKRNMLPFVLTSVILWTVLCLFICAFMDITKADLETTDIFVKVEKIELIKYCLPFLSTIGNLLLVAFFSLAILLGDAQMIAHHLNCWSAALHEMETSAALDIRGITCNNLKFFLLYTGVYTAMFVLNWPKMLRGSCGLTAIFMLRPVVPFLRVSPPATLFFCQWIGFGVHLYILFCARMVMTMLQIFALMLKNVSEMWNFKFALTYKLLAVENRGTLYQLQLNHSLGKLWSHHRLITVLLEQYGLVFSVGIMCCMMPQCLIFAIAMAKLVLFNVHTRQEYYKDEPNILVYSDEEPTIEIPAMSFIFLVFSIIIRIQNPEEPFRVTFPPPGSCSPALGQTLVRGICAVTMNPAVQPPPAPPPATYYFIREHCQDIESKHQSKVESFEYYSDGVRIANTPPFQICNVTLKNGTTLPQPLLDFGRYFEDFGSNSIKRTLDFYMDRTYDPKSIDYKSIIIATTGFHPDTTEGGYCGPDSSGQLHKRCEWVEYFRDCMIGCYSRKLNRKFLIPMLLKKDIKTNTFTLYNDYNVVDCGVNPFAIKKGKKPADAAYDCFGRKMDVSLFDSCGNLPFYETKPIYIPVQAYPNQFYWTYSSSWELPEKTFPRVSVPGIPNNCPKSCYTSEVGTDRCSDVDIVRDHCELAHYWGPISNGYFYAQHCYDLNIDPVSRTFPTGFCNTDVPQGAVEDEDAIYESTYNDARTSQWDRSFDLSVDDVPCKDYDTMSLIKNRLYFQQVCIYPTPPNSPDPCNPLPSFFPLFRPYELICRQTLKQIKFDYEIDNGNSQICDYNKKKMKLPVGVSVQYIVEGVIRFFPLFYGCHGKPLFPMDPKHNCLHPELNGVCEVNSGLFLLLYGDCLDPDVVATGFMIAPVADLGLCQQFINLEHPIFENNLRKLVSQELLDDLKNPWKEDPWSKSITIRDSPGTSSCSVDLNAHYCGVRSVALNYPYDGYDSRTQDRFLCNWEAYYRDCIQPYRSKFGTDVDWMYLPKWVPSPTLIQSDVQRNSDPVLNSFAVHPAKDLVTCDGRSFPANTNPSPGGSPVSSSIDDYWMDDCGWVLTPEFVDGDPKSLAIMAPILPIALDSVYDDDGKLTTKIIHCYDSEVSLFRCTHPDVFPICKRRLALWEPTQGAIITCYRYNSSCFIELNKQPIGGGTPFLHPPGFCRGYCPHVNTLTEAISEQVMSLWGDIENMEFSHPPCLAISNSTPQIFLNNSSPRQVEKQLFLQIHCNDPSANQLVTNHFWWPLYKTTRDTLKLIPRQLIRSHLEATFGSACDYGGITTEENIYPKSVTFMDGSNLVTVAREDFYGCHGFPLVLFSKFYSEYPDDLIDVTDPETDYDKVCHDQRLAGWCEVELETFYFLKEDFEVTCNDCVPECTSRQGYLASTNFSRIIEDHSTYPFLVKADKLLRNK